MGWWKLMTSSNKNNMDIPHRKLDFVDTHCHLDLYKSPGDIINESEKNGVQIVAVTNIPSVFKQEIGMFNSDNVSLSLGFHPQLIKDHHKEIGMFISLLQHTRFIGEVGLDYSNVTNTQKQQQKSIFQTIVQESAKYKNKIMTVHSRRSAEDVVSIIGANFEGTVILHWYNGSISTLKKAVVNGCHFSINPSMINSKNGQKIIKSLPLERILTETDGPVTKVRNKVTTPSDVKLVIEYLSKLHNKDEDSIAKIIMDNFNIITKD